MTVPERNESVMSMMTEVRGLNDHLERDGVLYSIQTQDFGIEFAKVVATVFARGAVIFKKEIDYTRFLDRPRLGETRSKIVLRLHRDVASMVADGKIQIPEGDSDGPEETTSAGAEGAGEEAS